MSIDERTKEVHNRLDFCNRIQNLENENEVLKAERQRLRDLQLTKGTEAQDTYLFAELGRKVLSGAVAIYINNSNASR